MLIPEPLEKALNFPWHLTKGVANLAAFPVRMLLNDNYLPENGSGGKPGPDETTVYDVIDPMLDNASMIYYYTELRSETNKRLAAYREDKLQRNKDKEEVERSKKELEAIRNAIQYKQDMLKKLQETDESSPMAADALKKYKESLKQMEDIKVRQMPNLTDGDLQVLETYFDILSQPKTYLDIKRDFELYNKYISPTFRASFGGKDFNSDRIFELIDQSPDGYVYKIDDDFVTTSLNPSGFFNKLNSELVYTICVSDSARRITVTFRGSVNANDWITNVNAPMCDLKLPGYTKDFKDDTRKSYGRVHQGFYDYLFGKTQVGNNGSNKSKAEEIMGILNTLLATKCQGYSVNVTGHSLGGAMSTLFAFRAAAFGEIPGIVTNVSVASPYVGDQSFRDSFYELEQKNQVRHVRVSNDEDIVPLIPFVGLGFPVENFKHTGVNIHLFNSGQMFMPKVRVFYPKVGSWPNEARNAVLNNLGLGLSVGVISKHLCPEYHDRMKDAKEDLKSITVEGLYSNTHLTGWNYTAP